MSKTMIPPRYNVLITNIKHLEKLLADEKKKESYEGKEFAIMYYSQAITHDLYELQELEIKLSQLN